MTIDQWQYKPAKDIDLAPTSRWKSERREPGLLEWLTHHTACTAGWCYFKAWHRLRIEGTHHVPRDTPFVVVANHSSHLDALVLATCMPSRVRGSVFPIAAGDVFFETPHVSAFAAAAINALPMWRKKVGRHALEELRGRLHSGDCGYILFPEGARTRDGAPMTWKPGIGMLVAGTRIPVVPCRIWGAFESLPAGKRVPRPRSMHVRMGAPLVFDTVEDSREGWTSIAAQLRDAVLSMDKA